MNYNTINTAFYVMLILGLAIGLALLIWWAKKIYGALVSDVERDSQKNNRISLNVAAVAATVRMLPGIVLFVLVCVPVFYFGSLRKQHDYCLDVIRNNKIKTTDDAFLKERCGKLDLNELLNKAYQSQ